MFKHLPRLEGERLQYDVSLHPPHYISDQGNLDLQI